MVRREEQPWQSRAHRAARHPRRSRTAARARRRRSSGRSPPPRRSACTWSGAATTCGCSPTPARSVASAAHDAERGRQRRRGRAARRARRRRAVQQQHACATPAPRCAAAAATACSSRCSARSTPRRPGCWPGCGTARPPRSAIAARHRVVEPDPVAGSRQSRRRAATARSSCCAPSGWRVLRASAGAGLPDLWADAGRHGAAWAPHPRRRRGRSLTMIAGSIRMPRRGRVRDHHRRDLPRAGVPVRQAGSSRR